MEIKKVLHDKSHGQNKMLQDIFKVFFRSLLLAFKSTINICWQAKLANWKQYYMKYWTACQFHWHEFFGSIFSIDYIFFTL